MLDVRHVVWALVIVASLYPRLAWAPSAIGGRPAAHFEPIRPEGRPRDADPLDPLSRDPELMPRLTFDLSPRNKQYADTLKRLNEQFDSIHPDKTVIDSLVKDMRRLNSRRSITNMMEIFDSKPKDLVSVTPQAPNILFYRPKQTYFDSLCDAILEAKFSKVQVEVDRGKLMLLSFVRSSEGRKVIKEEVAQQYQIHSSLIDRITSGDFDEIDASTFRPLKGQTVVIVGHVENQNGKVGFEVVAKDGETKVLPFETIEKAAQLFGFDYVLLGCETGKFAEIGTLNPINDVDAVRAFVKARKTGGRSTFAQLLADLSSVDLQFIVDLGHVGDRSMTPLGLTRHGHDPATSSARDGGFRSTPSGVPTPVSSPINAGTQFGGGIGGSSLPPSSGFGGGSVSPSGVSTSSGLMIAIPARYRVDTPCTADVERLDRSKRWFDRFPSIESLWNWLFLIAAALWMLVGLFEVIWRSNLSIRDRWANLAKFTVAGSFVTLVVVAIASDWLRSGLSAEFLGFVGIAVITLRFLAGRRFPDHRMALIASLIWVSLAQVPPLTAVCVDRAIAQCFLEVPFPL